MSYLYIGSGFLIVFIITLILGKKGKSAPDVILIAWLSVFLANVVTLFLVAQDGHAPDALAEKMLFEFSEASIFIHGPFFWLYTLALTKPKFTFQAKHLLHGVLFAVSFLYLVYGVIYSDGVSYYARKWLIVVKMISLLLYMVVVLRRLRQHRVRVQHIFSNTEERQLDWLYLLCWGGLIVWIISSISLMLGVFLNFFPLEFMDLFSNLGVCAFIYLVGYFGVRQTAIFTWHEFQPAARVMAAMPLEIQEEKVPEQEEKYRKSGLNPSKAEKIWQDLLQSMDDRQLYLDPDLSLFSLAEQVNTLPNHLSQVINEKENQNFFDFVNGYRVNAVKSRILSGKLTEHTLLGIALDCGFNSKASFNRAFKKHTGLTPTEFKNQGVGGGGDD
jgi:AraC-like DNA-binding protein